METILEDYYKWLKYDDETNMYFVEYIDEIQTMGWGEETFGDEVEFDNLQEAKEFYYDLDEPKTYRGIYDERGFRWR